MRTTIALGDRETGRGHPCFVIAEAGVNHNGSIDIAMQLVDAAVEARADAIKFQTFRADRLVTSEAPCAEYQQRSTGSSESQLQMLRRLELSSENHQLLSARCKARRILFLSSPFDEPAVDLLEELGIAAYKVPSGEITNLGYLRHVASKQKPVILSTGMSNLGEVEAAVEAVRSAGNNSLILLHCVSAYPADPKEANLLAMNTIETAFGTLVGYSDHTLGNEVSLAAVALGACVLEKHLTLDRTMPGPDHQASADPREFAELVRSVRVIESALGTGIKTPTPSERNTADVARKSLVAARDIPEGSRIGEECIGVRRPGTGLPPSMRARVVGMKARVDIPAGTLLRLDLLQC